jgi:hypothetical protein
LFGNAHPEHGGDQRHNVTEPAHPMPAETVEYNEYT